MGASESSGRSNGTEKEKEEQRQRNSSGSSTETAVAIALAAAGVAVTAWGISKMLSDDTDTQERDDAIMIKPHGEEQSPSIRRFPHPPDRFRSINTYHSIKGESSRGICSEDDDHVQVRKQGNMWHPPPRGRFKMNTAAVSGPNRGSSCAYAGILRNDDGDWVRGFLGFIGVETGIQTAELFGIYKGLMLLDKFGFKASILESDSDEAVFWINEKSKSYDHNFPQNRFFVMIIECRRLALKNNITIHYITNGDANRCADKLAAAALTFREEYFEVRELPDGIKSLVDKDKQYSKFHEKEPAVNIRGFISEGVVQNRIILEAKKGSSCSIWSPPGRGCFKMNTDGACRPNPGGLGGYGGILRNDNGDFVCGFYGFIGATDGLTAEFHGILKGLQLLVKRGYTGLILETDCQAAHEWVTEKTRDRPSNSEIISNCWNIITECRDLAEFYKIDIKIIVGKHANRCADKLAAMALKEQDKYVEIKHVPDEIKSFVDNDKKKKPHGRAVVNKLNVQRTVRSTGSSFI